MDWIGLPSLAALRAFSAFAETGNVVKAGTALNVSHAAISQQLRLLEEQIGVPLLNRKSRPLELTEEGAHLARALVLGFSTIQTAVQEVSDVSSSKPLHITCTPMFAAQWLMPRLAAFREKHPEIDLVLDPTGEVVEFSIGGVDLGLRYGEGDWKGLEAEMLLQSPMVVVAAPKLLDGRRVHSPQELLDFPWLQELGTTEAAHWLQSRNVAEALRGPVTYLPGNLLMQAVRDGQGVAVSVRAFVEDDIARGRLAELFCEDDQRGYHIITRPGVQRRETKAFLAWLRRQRQVGHSAAGAGA